MQVRDHLLGCERTFTSGMEAGELDNWLLVQFLRVILLAVYIHFSKHLTSFRVCCNTTKSMVKAKKYVLEKYFDGLPKKGDLKLVEEELPPLKDSEILTEAVFLSVDPYMRAYAISGAIPLGTTFIGAQVAKIIESKSKDYPVGRYVVGQFGWRNRTIASANFEAPYNPPLPPLFLLPDFEGLPVSLGIGVLGMTGNSAYFGFLEICQPKSGETVVVTGAAGAVGNLVGQIAKIKGCRVVGIAGSDEKGKWLVDELGFDGFVNYKKPNLAENLKKTAPNGIDCYFDNVGGEISSIILGQMNNHGRISVCGAISAYNAKEGAYPSATVVQPSMVFKQLKMEGFLVWRWNERWLEGILQMKKWIQEEKIKYRETVTEGFDHMFEAFVDMLEGGNAGKAVVRA